MQAFTLIDSRYSTGAIVQPISPRTYIMSDQLIKLQLGVFGSAAGMSISLLAGLEPSALVSGVTIAQEPSLLADGFRIKVSSLDFGMSANPLFDSIAVNNISATRRVVIRTLCGTAIVPPSLCPFIQN